MGLGLEHSRGWELLLGSRLYPGAKEGDRKPQGTWAGARPGSRVGAPREYQPDPGGVGVGSLRWHRPLRGWEGHAHAAAIPVASRDA